MIKQSKSLQLRRRYLLLDSISKEDLDKKLLSQLGVLGYAKALPKFVDEDNKEILAVTRQSLDEVKKVLNQAGLKIRKISGTIKGLR